MRLHDSFRIFLRSLVKFFAVAVVLYVAAWCYFNWSNLRESYDDKNAVKRYGIAWYTDLGAARSLAANHKRDIMIVCVRSNAKEEASDSLINRIFPSAQFQSAADTYIPVLADIREGVEDDISTRNSRDEIISTYNLRNRYGCLILVDAKGEELRRVNYTNESVAELLDKLSGGKFTPLPPVLKADVKESADTPKPAAPAVDPKSEKPKVEEKWGFSTGL